MPIYFIFVKINRHLIQLTTFLMVTSNLSLNKDL